MNKPNMLIVDGGLFLILVGIVIIYLPDEGQSVGDHSAVTVAFLDAYPMIFAITAAFAIIKIMLIQSEK